MNRNRCLCFCGLVTWAALAGNGFAQQAASPGAADDPMERPTESGIRLTPGMARAFAGVMTREFITRRYELDEAKRDQATEAMARRIMDLAHRHDNEQGQEFGEYIFTQALESQAKGRRGGGPGMTPEFAKGVGERILPMLPDVREMINGALQDIRPMLSLKQQLKMTADITMVNVGLDAFEKNMQKWSTGQGDLSANPFENEEEKLRKDADGQTRVLKDAQRTAESASGRAPGSEWEQYIVEAKKYYELDASQVAVADSLLRDYKERARIAVGGADEWHARVYRNRIWWGMSAGLPGRWNNPLHTLLDWDLQKAREPLDALGDELKGRIDQIPTQAQRDAAERRIQAAFKEKGLVFEESKAAATAPTASAESAR